MAEVCDIITFHTPLVREGEFPTYHLADKDFFLQLKRKPIIINSGRGEVVDNEALLSALETGSVSEAIIDTWEHEPEINRQLLEKVYIGTPHIAGYSADGKANATEMVLNALCRHFSIDKVFSIHPPSLDVKSCDIPADDEALPLFLYDPTVDSEALKSEPSNFEYFRGHYPLRREALK